MARAKKKKKTKKKKGKKPKPKKVKKPKPKKIKAKKLKKLKKTKKKIKKQPIEEFESVYTRGNKYFSEGKYKEAIKCYKKCVKFFPDPSFIHYFIGIAHFNMENFTLGSKYLKEALQIQSDEQLCYYLLTSSYLSPNLVRKLSKEPDNIMRMRIASRIIMPDDVEESLAEDESMEVRKRMAVYPLLSKKSMSKLADDVNKFVRLRIASRSDLPNNVLEKLSSDDSYLVRLKIAEHKNLPKKAIQILCKDKNWFVRRRLEWIHGPFPV